MYYFLSLVKYQLIIFIGVWGRFRSLSLDSNLLLYLSTLCCCSVTKFCPILRNLMDGSMPGLPVPHHLLEFAQVHVAESVMPPNHFILCLPLLLLPLIFPSIKVFFQWVSCLLQVAKVLELQHQSFQRVVRVDFFKIDWLDLLAF